MFSKYYQDQFINIYEEVLKPEKIVSHLSGSDRSSSSGLSHLPVQAFDTQIT